jgi:ectoine hydroxylase-related dioxygenase (phytanoyl-CoA dioxygenase family)
MDARQSNRMRNGYAIVADVLERTQLDQVTSVLASDDNSRAGRRHLMRYDVVREIANDSRLLMVAADALGDGAKPFKATLFDKSPDSNWLVAWHQDVSVPVRSRSNAEGWGPWSTKDGQLYAHAPAAVLDQIVALRVHLDDSTLENGPLRVLPNTHTLGRLSEEQLRALAREVQPIDCTVGAGGVIAMRPLIVHASPKSRSSLPRRVLHIEYAKDLNLDNGIQLAVA